MQLDQPSGARLQLPADPAHIASARRFVRETFASCHPDVIADLTLIVSELVTNAVEHGSGGDVVVETAHTDVDATVRVVSPGPSPHVPDVSCWNVGACSGPNGRGLGIVVALATRVEVERSDQSLVTIVTRSF